MCAHYMYRLRLCVSNFYNILLQHRNSNVLHNEQQVILRHNKIIETTRTFFVNKYAPCNVTRQPNVYNNTRTIFIEGKSIILLYSVQYSEH